MRLAMPRWKVSRPVDRGIAELLMQKLEALNGPMNEVLEVIEQISDDDEKKAFRMEAGGIICDIYLKVTRPIATQFPDLCPSKNWQD